MSLHIHSMVPYTTYACISPSHLMQNFRALQHHAGTIPMLPMIKANAYGHGIVECMRILHTAGAEQFGIAWIQEAILLRMAGYTGRLIAMMPPFIESADEFLTYNVECVMADLNILRHYNRRAEHMNQHLHVHMYIDTGMRRDGIEPHQALDFMRSAQELPHISIKGICTHFARADDQDSTFTEHQLQSFYHTLDTLEQAGFSFRDIHASNSAGLIHHPHNRMTLMRPGIALYTHGSMKKDIVLQPALSLHTRIISLRDIDAGESVSYGTRFIAQVPTRIATIPIGYGDGFLRALSTKAECLIHGKRFPIVGTICMDQCMVNLGVHADILPLIRVGDSVTLIGTDGQETITAFDLAQQAQTIEYEIMTNISARVPRIYADTASS